MSYCKGGGRFGNKFFRAMALNLLSDKHDVCASYELKEDIESLGLTLNVGSKVFDETFRATDRNFMTLLNKDCIDKNLKVINDYFQTQEITNEVFRYINQETIKNGIMKKNIFNKRYNNNNDCFIHIRLGDVHKYNPGFSYYDKILQKISYDRIFISTDDKHSKIIKELLEKYQNAVLVEYSITETILFASTCKFVILSYGTFSAVIGYFSFHSYVFCVKFCEKNAWDWNSKGEFDYLQNKSNSVGDWIVCE